MRLAEGDDAIVFTHTVDGRPTGEAYIELADKDAQTAAMMRHKELMGSRYIEIFHSSKMDKLQAQQQRMVLPSAMFGRCGAHKAACRCSCCAHLRIQAALTCAFKLENPAL